jgi:hypothetical protein
MRLVPGRNAGRLHMLPYSANVPATSPSARGASSAGVGVLPTAAMGAMNMGQQVILAAELWYFWRICMLQDGVLACMAGTFTVYHMLPWKLVCYQYSAALCWE